MNFEQLYKPGNLRTGLFRPVDKLLIGLDRSYTFKELQDHLDSRCIPNREIRLNDKRDALEVGPKGSGVIFRLTPCWGEAGLRGFISRRLVTRPSFFKNWYSYQNFLEQVLPIKTDSLPIYRIDYTCDIPKCFPETFTQLQIDHKYCSEIHRIKSGRITGLYYGRESRFLVYTKKEAEGLNYSKLDCDLPENITRIEYQHYRNKLTLSQVRHHLESILKEVEDCPFQHLTFRACHLKEGDLKSHDKFCEIRTLLQHLGFTHTKRYLNGSKNFEKVFGKFFTKLLKEEQPSFLYKQILGEWLNGQRGVTDATQ